MISAQKKSRGVAILQGQNNLPIVETFENLVEPEGEEAIRIRFSLDRGRVLDLPLSAKALAGLVQPLSCLRGTTPEKMPEGIAYLRNLGLISPQ